MNNPRVDPNAGEPAFGRSVSIDQAARLLDVSRRTIYNRIRDGRLKTMRTIGGSQRVLIESLQSQVATSSSRAIDLTRGAIPATELLGN